MAIEQKSKSELSAALSRARGAIQSARKETRQITKRAARSALTVGAGYGVGALRNKFGTGSDKKLLIPGTEIEGDLAVGVILALAGVAGLGDDYSEELTAIGSGTLAGYVAIQAFNHGGDLR